MIIVSDNQVSNKLFAVSFDTVTYRDLQSFLFENNCGNYELTRIDPLEFIGLHTHAPGSYINLITKDMKLRQQISEIFECNNLFRFSLIHEKAYTHFANIGLGCMVYPMVSMYTNTTLSNDIIVHSMSMIAHDCSIGLGSYISAGVNVAGTTKIGKFCQIGLAAVITDNINIVDNTVIGMNTMVRKSIVDPGVYINQTNSKLIKLR